MSFGKYHLLRGGRVGCSHFIHAKGGKENKSPSFILFLPPLKKSIWKPEGRAPVNMLHPVQAPGKRVGWREVENKSGGEKMEDIWETYTNLLALHKPLKLWHSPGEKKCEHKLVNSRMGT